jgi:hypothetical protein
MPFCQFPLFDQSLFNDPCQVAACAGPANDTTAAAAKTRIIQSLEKTVINAPVLINEN